MYGGGAETRRGERENRLYSLSKGKTGKKVKKGLARRKFKEKGERRFNKAMNFRKWSHTSKGGGKWGKKRENRLMKTEISLCEKRGKGGRFCEKRGIFRTKKKKRFERVHAACRGGKGRKGLERLGQNGNKGGLALSELKT